MGVSCKLYLNIIDDIYYTKVLTCFFTFLIFGQQKELDKQNHQSLSTTLKAQFSGVKLIIYNSN